MVTLKQELDRKLREVAKEARERPGIDQRTLIAQIQELAALVESESDLNPNPNPN